ncbi:MAG: cellulose biosynthesis protein BcsG [Nitrosomonadales bacterium]|nr:cellulose biosynthesis protein BcsG [Nitrosomonadales bacterium]
MGIWNFYFIAKLFLYFGHYAGFHVWLNLAFAISLVVPIPERYARYKLARQLIAIPAGIALFYYDTWLPPITRVFAQAGQLEGFSLTYLAELAGRFFNPLVIAALLLLYAIYFLASKRLRMSSFVFLAMLAPLLPVTTQRPDTGLPVVGLAAEDKTDNKPASAVPDIGSAPLLKADDEVSGDPQNFGLTARLNSFYRKEAARSVAFARSPSADAPFDIIFLQICSLSWDDLNFTGEQENPLFKRFNIVFSNFNSASSYSGPAVIRLLRGSCGQPRHSGLYDPAAAQCQTFNDLQKAGFDPQLAMNHDGHYGGFLADVRERGGLQATPFDVSGLPAYLKSFDGTPVYDDYEVLAKWWKSRLDMPAQRVALFYNTVSLHDGNRYSGDRSANSMEIYHPRQTRLLADLDRFFSELQASGRRAVVVFVAEHGASVRGDKMQIAGLREIPSPRISLVPAGIKLIGFPENPAPLLVSKPTSYLAISQLLANFIRTSPFGKNSPRLEEYLGNLPTTEFVAENESIVVMRSNRRYFIHDKDEEWVEYEAD